jgi:hypothetical protein
MILWILQHSGVCVTSKKNSQSLSQSITHVSSNLDNSSCEGCRLVAELRECQSSSGLELSWNGACLNG